MNVNIVTFRPMCGRNFDRDLSAAVNLIAHLFIIVESGCCRMGFFLRNILPFDAGYSYLLQFFS